jgi:putative ABC transport system permease protein
MLSVALKMLIGNKVSFLGVLFGIFLATLLISQQSAIFLGLVARSYRLVTDIPSPNIWIIDPATESDEKVRGIPEGYLEVVRSIPAIEWAVPLNVADIPLTTPSGIFHVCQLYGIDDATLIGAPIEILEGNIRDLNRENSILIDSYSATSSLAKIGPDGKKIPLKLGDYIEINNHRAVIVGICKITQGFYPQPIIFTTISHFKIFAYGKNTIDFIAAKTRSGANVKEVLKKINAFPVLTGLTRDQLKWRIAKSFLQTGILINFALSVGLGIIIGFSIAGQIFYIMTLENLKYYALIKAIGGNERLITKMIITQAIVVGVIGFLLGTGATLLWGIAIQDTTLAFLFPWQLLLFTGFLVIIICLFTAGLSLHKVFAADPKTLLGN